MRTYVSFKNTYTLENYVNIHDIPLSWRKLYCSYRISCHNLEIERGRYARPHIPPHLRFCKLCHSEAETEMHFVLSCNIYHDLREKLFNICVLHIDNFMSLNNDSKFQYLLDSSHDNVIRSVMAYIYQADQRRKVLLSVCWIIVMCIIYETYHIRSSHECLCKF